MEAIVDDAARLGYREVRLDTLPSMTAAIAMYRAAGFAPIPPYYDTAPAGTIFLGRRITPRPPALPAAARPAP
jgi:ribosomal protein S18 acetylase RimI-like enzyme